MSNGQFFTRVRGDIAGPFTEEEICNQVRQGRLGRMHKLSSDGQNWQRAEDFPQFFSVVTPDVGSMVMEQPPLAADPPPSRPRAGAADNSHVSYQNYSQADSPVVGLDDLNDVTYIPDAAEPTSTAADTPTTLADTWKAEGTVSLDPLAEAVPNEEMWYVSRGGQRAGPYTQQQVIDLLTAAHLTPYDYCWAEGMSQWLEIQSLPTEFPIQVSDSTQQQTESPRTQSQSHYDREPAYSGMAVTSFVLSLIPAFALNCPLSIVFGLVGIQQINESRGRLQGIPLSIAGIVISCISLILWAVFFFVIWD